MKTALAVAVTVAATIAVGLILVASRPAQGRIPTSWHRTFSRTETVSPGHVVHTVVVPVQERPGVVVDCVISEDALGVPPSLAMSCDFATPLP